MSLPLSAGGGRRCAEGSYASASGSSPTGLVAVTVQLVWSMVSRVAFSSHATNADLLRTVDGEAVGVSAARQCDPLSHGECSRVDHREIVAEFLHSDEHPVTVLVVADVADLPAEGHGPLRLQRGSVDNSLCSAAFIGRPDRVADAGLSGQPVRILPVEECPADLGTRRLINRDHLIGTGSGGIHPIQ